MVRARADSSSCQANQAPGSCMQCRLCAEHSIHARPPQHQRVAARCDDAACKQHKTEPRKHAESVPGAAWPRARAAIAVQERVPSQPK